MRKGQISIFVIIGVVILIVGLLFFVFRATSVEQPSTIIGAPAGLQPVYLAVQNCLEKRAESGINLIGMQGGYIYLPEKFVDLNYTGVAFGRDRKKLLPSKAEMQTHLELFIDESSCNLSGLKQFDIKFDDVSSSVEIMQDHVQIDINYPVYHESKAGDYSKMGKKNLWTGLYLKFPLNLDMYMIPSIV